MSFISVIVPVFNAEQYIDNCLASILNQTYKDWEVVLVDDGSSDRSPEICDRYAASDSRIRVIHQTNSGTSAARNTGVSAAQGTYLTFMDNDDWWLDSDCLNRIVTELKERPVDLLCHMSCRANPDGTQISDRETTKYSDSVAQLPVAEAIRFIIDAGMMTSAVWTKIVRRDLLRENGIVFPAGMRNEDTQWSARVLASCESIGWIDERFYVYRMGHAYAQTSHKLSVASVTDLETILRDNLKVADSLEQDRGAALKAFLAYPFIVWVGQAAALGLFQRERTTDERYKLLGRMKEVVCFSKAPAARISRYACSLFGAKNTARLLGLFFKKKYPQHRS